METYKIIENYPNYSISNLGNVMNNKTNKLLQCKKSKTGYVVVNLYNNKVGKTHNVHTLVGKHFIDNLNNKPCIDHIDNNKENNHFTNLRFTTYSENMQNRPLTSLNKSGIKGVFYNKITKKWSAVINVNKRKIHIGNYEKFEDAMEARIIKSNEYFGEYANAIEKIVQAQNVLINAQNDLIQIQQNINH